MLSKDICFRHISQNSWSEYVSLASILRNNESRVVRVLRPRPPPPRKWSESRAGQLYYGTDEIYNDKINYRTICLCQIKYLFFMHNL